MLLINMQGHGHHPVCFCKKRIHYKHLNECTCCTAGLLHCMTSILIAHDFAVVRPGGQKHRKQLHWAVPQQHTADARLAYRPHLNKSSSKPPAEAAGEPGAAAADAAGEPGRPAACSRQFLVGISLLRPKCQYHRQYSCRTHYLPGRGGGAMSLILSEASTR